MGKLAQIALGAVIAVAVSAASIHADSTLFGDRSLSHWQNAQLAVNAKLETLEAALLTQIENLLH
ncbi:MAG: hypothetical protein WCA81_14625 [Rhizomicrobium sp.]|jgi:sensor domain CHASE-containing protein